MNHTNKSKCIQSGPTESEHLDFLFCLELKTKMQEPVEFGFEGTHI